MIIIHQPAKNLQFEIKENKKKKKAKFVKIKVSFLLFIIILFSNISNNT